MYELFSVGWGKPDLREQWQQRRGSATDRAGYHYWGADVLTRLRGMFAFALWERDIELLAEAW
ncbi:hypothetical protein [Mycobacterium seoulense]|uniref:hypothetical protein n=1 Tax=Mycobacterium seoulense TaxID=386911 RepID=UPI003557D1F6